MSGTNKSEQRPPVIALYTPFLQGFYIGELVNQIRQLSFIKGYKLIVIRTGSYGRFNEQIHIEGIDAAIIIRNAVANDLAEQIVANNIACVSIAYDYFPLKMPIVASDNAHGISLAFEHLKKSNHTKIAFVGDLSHYDIRKRYEYYCDLHERDGLPLREEYLINVEDTLFSGGIAAAKAFLHNQCDATAIVFGVGLTGVGFIQHMRSANSEMAKSLEYVCFDALSMIPVFTPEMTSVDQNLNLIVYRAFNAIENQLNNTDFDLHVKVPPKLTRVGENPTESYDAFIATCIDLPELHNPNYMKSLISNIHEWPREIIGSQLDQLMSIAPLFGTLMGRAALSRYFIDNKGTAWIKTVKTFSPGEVTASGMNDSNSLCKASSFPPAFLDQVYSKFDNCIHIPISVEGKIWGLLSFFGDPGCKTPASSYYGFSGYIESIVKMYEQDLELKTLRKRVHSFTENSAIAEEIENDEDAVIEWSIDGNHTSWSESALAKLGYISPIEANIFRNMEITDRIHPDDIEKARAAVAECKESLAPFQFPARYRAKSRLYVDVIMQGKPQLDEHNKLTGILFSLGIKRPGQ